jgi:hypothetical protein
VTLAFVIRGHVLKETNARLAGLTVILSRRDRQVPTDIATAISAADGSFLLEVPERGKRPDAYQVRFQRDGEPYAIVGGPATWRPHRPPSRWVYRVRAPAETEKLDDTVSGPPAGSGSVRGRVSHDNGTPAEDVVVKVYQRLPGEAVLLGTDTADSAGRYSLTYTYPTLSPDLFVVVETPGGSTLRRSTLYPDSPAHIRIDLSISDPGYRGASEYAQIHSVIGPHLSGVDLTTLDRQDVARFARRSHLPRARVAAYLAAQRLAAELTPEAEALYGLLRQGVGRNKAALVSQGESGVTAALAAAAQANQISSTVASTASTVAENLLDDAVTLSLASTTRGALGPALAKGAPTLTLPQRSAFLRLQQGWTGTAEAFWTALQSDPAFDGPSAAAARTAVQLAHLTLNHPSLAEAFRDAHGDDPKEAAGLSAADWLALMNETVDGNPVSTPSWVEGEDETARRAAYADLLMRQARGMFPSERVRRTLLAADPGETEDLTKLLSHNPDFHFRSSHSSTFFDTADTTGIADLPALQTRVRRLQRLYRIAPLPQRSEVMTALETAGFGSARAIARTSRQAFVETHAAALGGSSVALEVHNRAKQAAGAADFLWSLHDRGRGSLVPSLPQLPAPDGVEGIPAYDTLFGHAGSCQCEPCLSITSPAAYFVDLMRWVEERGAYELLDTRRPDLKGIALSCDNTDTVLPFVDLAIEVLEVAVVNVITPDTALVPTSTTREADELLTQPEHIHAGAYDILRDAVWPQTLPYDYPADQVRETLRAMGQSWADLIELYRTSSGPSNAQLAAIRLGGSAGELDRLLDTTPASPHLLWGYPDPTVEHPAPGHTDTEAWYVALRWVPEVLERGAVSSFEDLRDVLHSRYVQGDADAFSPLVATSATTCEVSDLYLGEVHQDGVTPATTPAAADFTRLQAFLRLRRRLGYTALDLDKVLHALGIEGTSGDTSFTDALVVALSALEQVRQGTGFELAELCSWWSATLDVFSDRPEAERPVRSLYDRLFLDPSRADPDSSPFALNEARTQLQTPSTDDLLASHEAELLAALRTTSSELAQAAALVLADLGTGSHLERNLDHLSRLYRKIRIAQAADLPVYTAFALAGALGADPEAGPVEARTYLEQLAELRARGLDPSALLWVLARDEAGAQAAGVPSEDELQGVLGRLRDELRALDQQVAAALPAPEATPAALRQELSKIVSDPAVLDTLVAILDGSSLDPADAQEAVVQTHLGHIVDVALVRSQVIDDVVVPPLALGWSLEHVRTQLLAVYARERVEVALSTFLGLELELVRSLQVLSFDALGPASILETLTDPDFVGSDVEGEGADPWGDLTREAVPAAYHAVELGLAVAWLLRLLEVSAARLDLWLHRRAALGLLRLEELPVLPSPALLPTAFAALRRTVLWFEGLSRLSPDESADALLDTGRLASLFQALQASGVGTARDATTLLHRGSLQTVVLGPPLDRTVSPQSVTIDDTIVLATSGTGWASDDAALVALRNAVRDDPTVGLAAGADQVVDADCLDGSGAVTNGVAASGNAAVSLRLTLLPGLVADITSATAQAVTAALLHPVGLDHWGRALALPRTLGMSASEIATWATHEPTLGIADGVRAAARGRYGTAAAWTQGYRPVRDALRQRQQTALVSWLLARTNAETEADLHARFLIDTAMAPCTMTSRLVQATASVQLFVQRCFLGLEEVALTDADALQWRWMKQYRLWEAARNVFLYPENWLLPELRLTKSFLFEAAESELLQEDPTPERVTRIAARYLEQLHALANPEVVAVWCETVREGDDIVHLVAQNQHQPARSYYRRYEHDASWTPWEELPFDIGGKSVALFVASQRTILLWLDLQEMSEAGVTAEAPPEPYLEIRLRWAERLGAEWSPLRQGPTLSSLGHVSDYVTEKHRYFLEVELQEDDKRVLLRISHRIADGELNDDDTVVLGLYELRLYSNELDFAATTQATFTALEPRWPFGYAYQGFEVSQALAERLATRPVSQELIDRAQLLELPVLLSSDAETHTVASIPFPLMTRAREVLRTRIPPTTTYAADYKALVVQDDARGYLLRPDGLLDAVEGHLEEVSTHVSPASTSGRQGLPLRDEMGLTGPSFEEERGLGVLDNDSDSDPRSWWADGLFQAIGFHLPFVDELLEQLRNSGMKALFRPDDLAPYPQLLAQGLTDAEAFASYVDTEVAGDRPLAIHKPYPIDQIAFEPRDGGAFYNWELFYHLPMLISRHLSQHARYEEALDWLHLIFDPRRADQVWAVAPLAVAPSASVDDWASFVDDPRAATPFASQVAAWLANPFDPHLVASMRPEAYQRATLMAYLDVLLSWGDARFAQDTRESVNEALQLYLYAQQVLGPKTERLKSTSTPVTKTYGELREELDALGNALIDIEELLPELPGQILVDPAWQPMGEVGYFCVQAGDPLEAYHGRVEDRLYKLRHCMNLQGVVRQLPLFAPPIDPGAIISALAAGADLGSALDVRPRLPLRRFAAVLQQAKELAGSARALGSALLSALEKQDGETLSLLRQRHELVMSDAITAVREAQIEEAMRAVTIAEQGRELADQRRAYYQGLLDQGLLEEEELEDAFLEQALAEEKKIKNLEILTGILFLLPQVIASVPPGVDFGGQHLGQVAQTATNIQRHWVNELQFKASSAGRSAGRIRRKEEWRFQRDMAVDEIEQHHEQISAVRIRQQIAERELSNHQLQRQHSEAVYDHIVSRFTSKELHSWMVAELSRMYSSSYQLALEVARQAEAAYRHEMGVSSSAFIRWTNWEGLRKGLLAGERLSRDLEQMEHAYYTGDIREREITKHVSLAQIDPYALLQLRETKSCNFVLHEVFFDLDFPGQYFRRLKSVSVTIPCVTGPYGGVNATLTLLSSHIRTDGLPGAGYPVANNDYGADVRFRSDLLAESISLSGGQADSGLFSADMRDARYLPFERRGAVSRWSLSIESALDAFDPASISDVVLHVQYTAREGGSTLKTAVNTVLVDAMNALQSAYAPETPGRQLVLSLKRDLPDAWHAFLHPPDTTPVPLMVSLDLRLFPRQVRGLTVTIAEVQLGIRQAAGSTATAAAPEDSAPLEIDEGTPISVALALGPAPFALAATYVTPGTTLSGSEAVALSWAFSEGHIEDSGLGLPDDEVPPNYAAFDPQHVDDIYLIVHYTVQ